MEPQQTPRWWHARIGAAKNLPGRLEAACSELVAIRRTRNRPATQPPPCCKRPAAPPQSCGRMRGWAFCSNWPRRPPAPALIPLAGGADLPFLRRTASRDRDNMASLSHRQGWATRVGVGGCPASAPTLSTGCYAARSSSGFRFAAIAAHRFASRSKASLVASAALAQVA